MQSVESHEVDQSHSENESPFLPPGTPGLRFVSILGFVIPLLGLVAAAVLCWRQILDWRGFAIFFFMYVISALGITGGYHRLFTHRAFAAVPIVRLAFGIMGSVALQGPLFFWVGIHRKHHQYSDRQKDPHSPHGHEGFWKGFWHSHFGWLMDVGSTDWAKMVPDLANDKVCVFVDKGFWVWVILGMLAPAAVGAAVWHNTPLQGALAGFLWGGLGRACMVHHVTWSVNSMCHLFGKRMFKTPDQSRNNWLVGWLALGEGWHNNHHAHPTSARHGLGWWQFDFTWMVILALKSVGLVSQVKRPAAAVAPRRS